MILRIHHHTKTSQFRNIENYTVRKLLFEKDFNIGPPDV